MPAEVMPAPSGQAATPVAGSSSVSSANVAIGTRGSTSVFQSMRHQVSEAVSPIPTRKRSAPLPAYRGSSG